MIRKAVFLLAYAVVLLSSPTALLAQTYYVDNSEGDDNQKGEDSNAPWKTIRKVNQMHFNPGDSIRFRRGGVWEETLVVSNSGVKGQPITYNGYGSGPNPRIKSSNQYENWKLVLRQGGMKVWHGVVKGVRNNWAAMRKGARVPMHYGYDVKGSPYTAPRSLAKIKNGLFYSPLNKEGFFFRLDEGPPGIMEIGVREYSIYIKGQRYIRIDGIDVFGPGGRGGKGSATGTAQIVVDSSENIVIKNLEASFGHNNGIRIANSSKNCTIENVTSHGHRATGIYLWEAGPGNMISNAEVYDCGTIETDTGDMGLIGVWQTSLSRVEACYVHDNGHPGAEGIDAAISIVQSPNTIVNRNLLRYIGGTGIQIAENSDGSTASYNVIEDWGKWCATFKSNRHCNGVRVGGGIRLSSAKNTRILNNLVKGGSPYNKQQHASLRIENRDSSGLEVRNNIFYANKKTLGFIAKARVKKPKWKFSNNLFYSDGIKDDPAIKILGKIYQYKKIIGSLRGYFSVDFGPDIGAESIVSNPRINLSRYALYADSPAIDRGVDVGLIEDFHGSSVPSGPAVDIGPFEYLGIRP